MKVYIITDTHFNHENMIEYCNRPENFNELIWKGLERLPKDCLLIHLGDVCIGNDAEVHKRIKKLPYRKILTKGNHDKKSNKWYLENGWDSVCDSFSDHFFGKYITFSHLPVDGVQNLNIHGHFHNNLHRLLDGKFVIEGEKERNEKVLAILTKNHKLLVIENTHYRPVSLKKFIE